MKRLIIVLFILIFPFIFSQAQVENSALIDSIKNNFRKQSQLFPQEKLYVQVDKPYYITGEDIWFRAHLTDALTLLPDTTSRYIYAELIDPLDSVQVRVKIRPQHGAYNGHIRLDEELPEGEYQLRFYTKFMEGLGDNFFFKRTIRIGDPLSALYRTELSHEYQDNNKKIEVELRFIDIEKGIKIRPDEVRVRNDKGELKTLKVNEENTVRVSLKNTKNRNVVYLEYDYSGKFHKQYIAIPNPDDFEVSFLPEGGHIILGESNRVAFKALNSNGVGEDINGVVVNDKGDTLTTMSTQHLGMGTFYLYQKDANEKIYAICRNKNNLEKRFELPQGTSDLPALQINWQKNKLLVAIRNVANLRHQGTFYMVLQTGGIVLNAIEWDMDKEFIIVPKEILPSGVIQIILVDANLNPLSERLIFNVNKRSLTNVLFNTNKTNYKSREKVNVSMAVFDTDSIPQLANFSLSVTDDKDVKLDTCINILSTMLLTSDLKGYVESPAYYFRNESSETLGNLDLLMMTQGWSRYNVEKILKGDFDRPKSYLELGPEISGTVKGGVFLNKKAANYPVRLLAMQHQYFDESVTDEEGCFRFNGFELPDSTQYIIQGNTKKGGSRVLLSVDEELYPSGKYSLPFAYDEGNHIFENYMTKADRRFILDNGMRMIYLKDVEITAKAPSSVGKSKYSSPFNQRITAEQIEKYRDRNIFQLLSRVPGVVVFGRNVTIRAASNPPLILIDDVSFEVDMLDAISIEDVDEVEVVKDAGTVLFGSRGASGVIMITTKRGKINAPAEQFNIKSVSPLGYQVTKEFYSPQYETRQQRENDIPDLRSTIYWNPSIITSEEGKANIDFYTSDASTTYSVVIEGITSEGLLIHLVQKIKREE